MLGRAFHDDPIQVAIVPDAARRARVLPGLFVATIRTAAAAGGHLTTVPDLAGVAVWYPPGVDAGFRELARTRFALVRAGLAMGMTALAALGDWAAILGRRQQLLPEPHWYLSVLGVEPRRHGEGVGSALLAEGLARADADGAPAYLETESEANVAFYARFGFDVVERTELRRAGVPMWLMVRR